MSDIVNAVSELQRFLREAREECAELRELVEDFDAALTEAIRRQKRVEALLDETEDKGFGGVTIEGVREALNGD